MARTSWRRNILLAALAGFAVMRLASSALTQAPDLTVKAVEVEKTPDTGLSVEEALEAENLPELPEVDASADAAEEVKDTDPLIEALMARDADALRKAIADGSDINRKTDDGSYPIIVAAVHSTADLMKIMTAYGVNPHVTDKMNRNSMHYAAILGDVEKAKLLFALRVEVNKVDEEGMPPLYYAYLNRHIPVADFLVKEAGADINRLDENGNMLALHVLKMEDNDKLVDHMIASGVSLFRRDVHGRTLVDLAKKMENEALATKLQKAYDEQLKQFIEAQQQEPEKK